MLLTRQILASALALAACTACLCACGQPGTLYLPTDAAAARRATLPQSIVPGSAADITATPARVPASAPTTKP